MTACGFLGPAMGKGVISQLQEFVQSSKSFPMPPSCPILQWQYDTRTADGALEFRATVAFLLDAVPHHIAGAWHLSKKVAQRDAAERSLGLLVGRWGEWTLLSEAKALEVLCEATGGPQWSHSWDPGSGLCRALVRLELLGVPHTFAGKPCETLEAAIADTSKRVLWYFQCPGFDSTFEPDPQALRAAAMEIPTPDATWSKAGEMQAPASSGVVVRPQRPCL